MSEFIDKLASQIIKNDGYSKASDLLFSSYVLSLVGERKTIKREVVKSLVTSVQVFYKSDNEALKKEGAIILSMLLDCCVQENPDLVLVANSIYVNIGDFPNISLLNARHPSFEFYLNFVAQAELDFRESLNSIDELEFTLTDFQRGLWAGLSDDHDIITVAPTSAGKTHIILSYLVNRILKSDGSFAAIIVPTRALISEVASNIYQLARELGREEDIEICTIPKDGLFGDKTFFVMTQERLHEVVQSGDITFDYLFIDEAHNIADNSRGVLLHITIEKVLEVSVPQIIVSMPSPSYQDSFSTIFGNIGFKKEITQHSPVAKVVMSVQPKGRRLIIRRQNSTNIESVEKGFKGKSLADIVFRLGKDQSNIIYRNKTSECEYIADEIAKRVEENVVNEYLEEAADYVEQFVHTEFSLANNLRKGVAFHYGPLPSSIRVMIEGLAKDGHVRFIACTSTLAEGINLPAKNLFLKNPAQIVFHKPSERIENVKISNITGRAGRMVQHFSGNIYLVEPDSWTFQDYFDEDLVEEDKIPTYFKSLNDELEHVYSALTGLYPHNESDQYRFYTIANKLIKDYARGSLDDTLSAEELSLNSEQRVSLEARIKDAYESLKVAAYTLDANPTVGYIQQNRLFTYLNEQTEFDSWLLPHPRSPNLYDTLLQICHKLSEFGIFVSSEGFSLDYVCTIARKWIQGSSFRDIILGQIDWDTNNGSTRSVNAAVRQVIKVINNDVQFRLANALRCYHLIITNILVSRNLDLKSIKIHSFIEVGACGDRMISLINMGLSREAAIDIDENLPNQIEVGSTKDLIELNQSDRLQSIHAITKKELLKLIN